MVRRGEVWRGVGMMSCGVVWRGVVLHVWRSAAFRGCLAMPCRGMPWGAVAYQWRAEARQSMPLPCVAWRCVVCGVASLRGVVCLVSSLCAHFGSGVQAPSFFAAHTRARFASRAHRPAPATASVASRRMGIPAADRIAALAEAVRAAAAHGCGGGHARCVAPSTRRLSQRPHWRSGAPALTPAPPAAEAAPVPGLVDLASRPCGGGAHLRAGPRSALDAGRSAGGGAPGLGAPPLPASALDERPPGAVSALAGHTTGPASPKFSRAPEECGPGCLLS